MPLRLLSTLLVSLLVAVSCSSTPVITPTEATLALSPGMSRDDAIAQLVDDTFLPVDKASCVVDAVYDSAGVYNPKSAAAVEAVDQSALVAACTVVDADCVLPERDEDAPFVEIEELELETGELEIVERFELTADTMPALTPGGLATGTVQLGGKNIDYVTITPPRFNIGDPAPVFLVFPPGGQDLDITRNVADAVYRTQALARGWVVVSPASPGGVWYDDDNTEIVPEFVSWMKAWVAMEGGRPHLGGMSNGGLSAFHIALQDPTQYHSLMAFPGFPESQSDRDKLATLADMPVHMWVGGDDPSWVQPMETIAADLRLVGGQVELNVLPGEPHVLQSTSNGIAIFNALTSAR